MSVAALTIAVLGSTPVGDAVQRLVLPKNSVGTAQLEPGAVVGSSGSLLASSGVKDAGGGPPHDISFERSDIRSCAYLTYATRDVWAEAEARAGANDTVRVFTGSTGSAGPRPFTLAVVC